MDRISINLLPPELKISKKKELKKQLAVRICVGLLLVMIVLTCSLLVVSITQKNLVDRETKNVDQLKTQVGTYKDQEAMAFLLKTRLNGVTQAYNKQYPQTQAFNLMTALTPFDFRLSAFRVDKSNKIELQGETQSTEALEEYFNNLTDPKINEGKITKINVSSLSKASNSLIRADLNVNTTGLTGQ